MTFAKASVRHFERLTSSHSLVLALTCCALLAFNFSPLNNFAIPNWPSESNLSNETEVDSALQQAANEALGRREGAIIVMDPQTGRVRALVGPQLAFTEALMPGSTMKPFTTLAALRSGLIHPDSRTVCPGRFTGISFSVPCVHDDHLPPFSPAQAIAYSCNYYFGTLGQRLGRNKLIETLRPFGFGQPTGLNEVKEACGTLQPCEPGNNARIRSTGKGQARQQADCDAREAIGESDHIQVTPIQLLTAYAALVNGGRLFQPQAESASEFHPSAPALLDIAPSHRAIITEGMRGAVRYGTAKSARLDSLALYILGKTGTSLPAKGFRTNGWFVGFAGPARNPGSQASAQAIDQDTAPGEIRLAVLIFLERSHGSEAAALSKSIFEAYADAASRVDLSGQPSNSSSQLTGDKSAIVNRQSAIRVNLVNQNITQELSLEDYVLGVLRAEGSTESEPEALKALTIAIRTYALKNHGRHAKDGYDFCTTTHCQRFVTGNSSPAMIQAVKATEGQVLTDDRGQLVDAYFSASCGGETANLGTLWGKTPPAYLHGVRDEFCVTGPHATWTDVITRADLLRGLQSDARTDVGARLDQVLVSKRDESGRAEFITLEGEHRKTVRGWDFKIIVGRVLGWNLLKSSRFEVSRTGSNFIFRGSGFGHGLGLCQEGAHVMAARGMSHRQILSKYFPGTTLGRGDRVATRLSGKGESNLNAECAEDLAEIAEESVCVPLRKPLRPLRLNTAWKADLLTVPRIAPTIGRSYPNSSKRLTISSEHFRVTYPAGVDRRDADQVLNALETARADYLHRLSAASISIGELPSLEIHINDSTGDFVGRTGQPWWAAAATRGNRIELQPVTILKRRGVLTTTLRHEFAHVVIDSVSYNHAPRWLEEGFAIYLAGEGAMISRYPTKAKLNTAEIEKRLERPGSQQEMRALYAAAYNAVLDLIKMGNEARVWQKLAGS